MDNPNIESNKMSPEVQKQVIDALSKAGVNLPCPRCGNKHFTLVEGFFVQIIQQGIKNIVLGGQSIPSIVTACSQCGFLSQHALGALKLMNLALKDATSSEEKSNG